MNKTKRIFLLFLCVTLLAAVTALFAACGSDGGTQRPPSTTRPELYPFSYVESSDGGISIYGLFDKSVKKVVIPDGVTEIYYNAFKGCDRITDVTISDSVKVIRDGAFEKCTSLTSVTMGKNVESIGYCVFSGCSSLEYNSYDNALYIGVGDDPYKILVTAKSADITSCEIHPDAKYIAGGAFSGCGMPEFSVPDGIVGVGDRAFEKCESLKTFGIGGGMTELSFGIFNDCKSLTNITIPENVTRICNSAFYACTSLESVTIPDSVTEIERSAFYGCVGLTQITIGKGVTEIGALAFADCESLVSVAIPDGVTAVRSNTFRNCISLKSVTIPQSVTTVENGAFWGCVGLPGIDLPSGLTAIGNSAFSDCRSFTCFTVPQSVTRIGDYVFYRCSDLMTITVPESVAIMGESVFDDCRCLTVYCEAESKPDGWKNNWNSSPERPVVWDCKNNDKDGNGYAYAVIDGIRYSLREKSATVAEQPKFITQADIPQTVTYNGEQYAVTVIGNSAFYGCADLESVTLPSGIIRIEELAFGDCTNLTTVNYGDTTAAWTSVQKESGWDYNTAAYTVHCTDSE